MTKRFVLSLLLLVAWSCEPPREAPGEQVSQALHGTQGTWASAGAVYYRRYAHTSTLLNDGTVLAYGGMTTSGSSAGAEIFHPAGAFAGLSGPNERWFHTATRLNDGRVLIAGGRSSSSALNYGYLFFPTNLSFGMTFSMVQGRLYHSAVLLSDGRVLLTGGELTSATPLSSAELYNPTNGTFTATASALLAPRSRHASVRLPNGKVLIAGGVASSALTPVRTAELFDPVTNTFQATGMMNLARSEPSLILLGDGKVLVVNGVNDRRAELYDPATGTFSFTGSTLVARTGAGAALLKTGEALLAGGSSGSSYHWTAELYDPATATWRMTGSLAQGRTSATATVLADGRVVLIGGLGVGLAGFQNGEVYTPSTPETVDTTPPVVMFLQPGANTFLGSSSYVNVAAADDDYVGRIDLLANGVTFASSTAPSPTFGASWSTTALSEGPATLTARAVDLQGNEATASLQVTVDRTPPSIVFTSPANGAALNAGLIQLSATASDSNGLSYVAFYDGSSFIGSSFGPSPYTTTWNTTGLSGTRTLRAQTYDPASNSSTATITVTVADTAPPSVSLTAPSAGAYVRGAFTASATASDNAGVARVEFLANGAVAATSTTSPYSALINSAAYADGPLTLTARAVDASNNQATTPSITVNVDNTLPVVAITSPAAGSTITGPTTVTATASDAFLTRVELYDNGSWIGTDTTAPFSVTWNPSSSGQRTLSARAYDLAGNVGISSVTVTVADLIPPSVSFSLPSNGAWASGGLVVMANATDNASVGYVEFLLNGSFVNRIYSSPYIFTLYTTGYSDGPMTLTARAVDASNNQATASITVTFDNTAPSVAITSPASGVTITGPVTVAMDAGDGSGQVTRVELYSGTTLLDTDTTAPYAVAWNPIFSGVYTLTARAYDRAGNMTTSAAVTVTANLPSSPVAVYSPTLRAPVCDTPRGMCDSLTLLNGRAGLGPEPNQPNTIGGSCADGTSGSYHGDESLDRLRVISVDGSTMAPGKLVRIEATVWVYSAALNQLDLYLAPNANSPVWTYLTTLVPPGPGAQTLTTTVLLPAGTLQAVRGRFRYGGTAAPCATGPYDDHDDLVFAVQ